MRLARGKMTYKLFFGLSPALLGSLLSNLGAPLRHHAFGARLPAPLAHRHGSGVFAFLLRRIDIFLDLACSDPHNLYGIRYNVSGALFAFGAFGHLVAFLDAFR